jgi:Flp pilus assembly protein TadD
MGKASRHKRREIAEKIIKGEDVTARSRRLPWWVIAALCLVAFLAFSQTLFYDFVFDDDTQVLRNPWIRDWSQVGNFFITDVWRFANESTGNYYRPFHMLAHAASYSLSGLNPWGFHLFNILLHCANTLLIAFIGYRLTRDRLVSAAGGILFALHPIHVESVAWIAGITDPLCAVFYFGALYVYLNDDPAKTWKTGLLTSLLFLGALFSKEMAFTLPLVIVLVDACLGRKLCWRQYALLAATFGIYAALRIHALSQFQIKQLSSNLSFHDHVLSLVALMGQYLAKAFIPFDISLAHVFNPTRSLGDPHYLLGILVILSLALAAWRLRSDRKVLFLVGFMPLALLPVMNISGIGTQVFSDRYLYIPTLGSCLLIPLIVLHVGKWTVVRVHVPWPKIAAGLLGAYCLFFVFMLWKNTYIWRDNLTLYTETMKRSPDSPIIAGNLARYYFNKGQNKEAAYWLSRSQSNYDRSFIKDSKALATTYVRLSAVCLREGKFIEAQEYLEKAHKTNPRDFAVLQNLGTVYIAMKDYTQARKWYEASLSLNPRNEISYNNLSFIYLQQNEIDKAIEYARKALDIFPRFGDAHLNLARGYAAKGLFEQASESYRNARIHNPQLASTVDAELQALQAGRKSN